MVSQVTYAAVVTSRPSLDQTTDRLPTASRAAGAICLVEAVLLLIAGLFFGGELLTGTADEASVASMSMILTLLFAVLMLVMAVHWWRGSRWQRTPTIVWNLLLLPAAWSLMSSSGVLPALAVAAVALAGLVSAWASPAPELAVEE